MTRTEGRLLLWAPRLLGALTCLFVGLFALDAFSEERPFLEALAAFAIHLAPAAFLCGIVAASWKREWVAGPYSSSAASLTSGSPGAVSIGSCWSPAPC